MARRLMIRGGTIVECAGRFAADVVIEGGSIASIQLPGSGSADEEIDATGLLILPGLVDAHVHVRDPGFPQELPEVGRRLVQRPLRLKHAAALAPRRRREPGPLDLHAHGYGLTVRCT